MLSRYLHALVDVLISVMAWSATMILGGVIAALIYTDGHKITEAAKPLMIEALSLFLEVSQ